MIETFLAGVICASSLTAALFFLRFWRDTRDSFFLAFAASFAIEGLSRAVGVFLPRANEGSPWYYMVRLLAFLLILFAILRKNYSKNG
jgi:uncharacterized membrane protein HdeD (DUF308 family)